MTEQELIDTILKRLDKTQGELESFLMSSQKYDREIEAVNIMRAELMKQKAYFQKYVEDLRADDYNAIGRMDQIEGKQNVLSTNQQSLSNDIEKLKAFIARIDKIDDFGHKLQTISNAQDLMKYKVDDQASDIKNLKKDTLDVVQKIDFIDQALGKKLEKMVEEVNRNTEFMSSDIKGVLESIDKIKSDFKAFQSEWESLKQEWKVYRMDVDSFKANLNVTMGDRMKLATDAINAYLEECKATRSKSYDKEISIMTLDLQNLMLRMQNLEREQAFVSKKTENLALTIKNRSLNEQ